VRRFIVVSLLVLVLAACGSSSKAKASTPPDSSRVSASTPPTPPTSASRPQKSSSGVPNACGLLTPAQVKAALGTDAKASASPRNGGNGGPEYSGCTWGDLTSEDAVVGVQVSMPSGPANIDYVQTLVGAVDDQGTAVAVGENGKLLTHAFVPGGGGDGQSILFTKNGKTVVVGMMRGSEANLKAAAAAVATNTR
jgi:hypothetical protein